MEDIKKVVEGTEAYVKPSMEVIDLGKKNDILTGSILPEKEEDVTAPENNNDECDGPSGCESDSDEPKYCWNFKGEWV